MTPSPEPPERFGFLHGVAFVLLGHALSIALFKATNGLSLLAIGLFQLIYVLPIVLIALFQGQTRVAQGALTAAGLTLLLNGILCASILRGFRHW